MAKAVKPPKPTPVNNIPAPTGLTAVRIDANKVQLTWNGVPNATSYWIFRDGTENKNVAWVIQDTKYIDVYATGQHSYAVAAVVNQVRGAISSLVTA